MPFITAIIDARLDTILTAGVDKVADNVSFAITPFYSFQYLWFPKTYDFFPASDTATKIAVLIPGGYYNYLQVIAFNHEYSWNRKV